MRSVYLVSLALIFAAFFAGMAFETYRQKDQINSTAATIDELKTKVDEANRQIGVGKASVASVDAEIKKLAVKSYDLNKDQFALRAAIAEAVNRFGELGFYVDPTSASVDDLIKAFQTLRVSIALDLDIDIQRAADLHRQLAEQLNKKLNDGLRRR